MEQAILEKKIGVVISPNNLDHIYQGQIFNSNHFLSFPGDDGLDFSQYPFGKIVFYPDRLSVFTDKVYTLPYISIESFEYIKEMGSVRIHHNDKTVPTGVYVLSDNGSNLYNELVGISNTNNLSFKFLPLKQTDIGTGYDNAGKWMKRIIISFFSVWIVVAIIFIIFAFHFFGYF